MTDRVTDSDIKKALERCITNKCDECAIYKECHNENGKGRVQAVLDLISRLEKENNDLFLELEGVMWSVDKWLDGDELKQDKVNRAITMREKTLQITEKQQAEIERLKAEIKETNEADREAEVQALSESKENAKLFCEAINHAKSEAIKKFWDKLITKRIAVHSYNNTEDKPITKFVIEISEGDNLVKEMTENDFKTGDEK